MFISLPPLYSSYSANEMDNYLALIPGFLPGTSQNKLFKTRPQRNDGKCGPRENNHYLFKWVRCKAQDLPEVTLKSLNSLASEHLQHYHVTSTRHTYYRVEGGGVRGDGELACLLWKGVWYLPIVDLCGVCMCVYVCVHVCHVHEWCMCVCMCVHERVCARACAVISIAGPFLPQSNKETDQCISSREGIPESELVVSSKTNKKQSIRCEHQSIHITIVCRQHFKKRREYLPDATLELPLYST